MDVFLSWSGERSRHVAESLKEWLPIVFDDVNPWLSTRDIPAGERWGTEIGRHLEKSDFGIICLTPENLEAPWILFEAGALSKSLDESHVCPYLFDVEVSAIQGPLEQFQATRAAKATTLELIKSINAAREHPMRETEQLVRRFEGLWDQFEEMLNSVPEVQGESQKPTRRTEEILEDLVETVRTTDRRVADLYARLGPLETLTAEKRPDPRLTQHPSWPDLMDHLKRKRQALTAAIYGEASASWDGDHLFLIYPEEQSYHVGMAKDQAHMDKLLDALDELYSVSPNKVTVLAQGPFESTNQ